jgi:aminopeptidase C
VVSLELLDHKVRQDHKVSREILEIRDSRVILAFRDQQVQEVYRVMRDLLV